MYNCVSITASTTLSSTSSTTPTVVCLFSNGSAGIRRRIANTDRIINVAAEMHNRIKLKGVTLLVSIVDLLFNNIIFGIGAS
jgi:hypothetical protein